MKKKRKRSTSSSSTSSSSSSTSGEDSPSTSHKKSKKRKRKRRRSSRSSKKHKRRMSSCSDKTTEEDCFPAPANTSASFINQKSITKLISEGERPLVKSHRDESGGRLEGPRVSENNKYGAHCRSDGPNANGEPRERHKDRRISDERREHAGNRRDSSSSCHSERSRRSEDFSSRGRRHSESEGARVERIDKEEKTSRDVDGGRKTGSQQKALPSNLMDIFSQIAEFEKEKKLKK